MTDLIDRYLAAVGRELPEAQRADIIAELRDELLSQIESREETLGRPLERAEVEAELIAFGNPLVVAGRYRKVQHLIGPEMFPFWWAGLKATLLVVAVVYLVLALLTTFASGDAVAVADKVAPSLTFALVFTFGVVTIVCAAVERYGKPGAFGAWKPRNLPPAHGRTRGRFEIMAEMGMDLVALAWWTGLIHFGNILPGVEVRVDLAPIWTVWFWPITAYFVGELAMNFVALLRPAWIRFNGMFFIARNLVGATILSFVLKADHIVIVTSDKIGDYALDQVQANFDRGFCIGLTVTIVIFLWLAALHAWRLRQFLRLSAGPASRAA